MSPDVIRIYIILCTYLHRAGPTIPDAVWSIGIPIEGSQAAGHKKIKKSICNIYEGRQVYIEPTLSHYLNS